MIILRDKFSSSVNLTLHSKYYSNSYMPLNGAFYNQNELKIGENPLLSGSIFMQRVFSSPMSGAVKCITQLHLNPWHPSWIIMLLCLLLQNWILIITWGEPLFLIEQ